ncbi:UNVERIFIED_CONTAM: hypothetical protein Slati_4362600 [Sesamum latifolium]|uniref:BRCT domain-containing protein n=1 Tax=Sesamum latifolium TaxID=2727402 RepID=A0AAW2SPA2_9LAMI
MIEKMGSGVGGGGGRVEVITGKGCSRLFLDFSSSFRGISSFSLEPFSPASSVSAVSDSPVKVVKSTGPFSGLVICVTGLSKETRKQVKEATERLGGQYSPHLHPHCTHLVIPIKLPYRYNTNVSLLQNECMNEVVNTSNYLDVAKHKHT